MTLLEAFQFTYSNRMFRELQQKYHPDKGGDIRMSQRINKIKDRNPVDSDTEIRELYIAIFGMEKFNSLIKKSVKQRKKRVVTPNSEKTKPEIVKTVIKDIIKTILSKKDYSRKEMMEYFNIVRRKFPDYIIGIKEGLLYGLLSDASNKGFAQPLYNRTVNSIFDRDLITIRKKQ